MRARRVSYAIRPVFLLLAFPAVAVPAIFAFINAWNEFIIALTLQGIQDSYTPTIQTRWNGIT